MALYHQSGETRGHPMAALWHLNHMDVVNVSMMYELTLLAMVKELTGQPWLNFDPSL
jgi:hypothetical protein